MVRVDQRCSAAPLSAASPSHLCRPLSTLYLLVHWLSSLDGFFLLPFQLYCGLSDRIVRCLKCSSWLFGMLRYCGSMTAFWSMNLTYTWQRYQPCPRAVHRSLRSYSLSQQKPVSPSKLPLFPHPTLPHACSLSALTLE